MISRSVAARLLIPAATLIAEKTELKCKPSELPIYTPETPKEPMKLVRQPGILEKQIGNIRKEVVFLTGKVTGLKQNATDLYDDSKAQVEWLIDYLQEENNTVPRAGAIAIGGLSGFILGLRGGFFRKLLFTSAGAVGMAAVCYPKEAADYSKMIAQETKKYLKIAYNFYHGVKKDDPPLELPSIPKIPTSPSEVWNLFSGTSTKKVIVVDKAPLHLSEVKEETPGKAATK